MNRGRHKKRKIENNGWLINVLGFNVTQKMMQYQRAAGNKPDLTVFEKYPDAGPPVGGFVWKNTTEGWEYWNYVSTVIKASKYFQHERS